MSTFFEILFWYFIGFAAQYFFLTAFYYSKEQETNREKAFNCFINAEYNGKYGYSSDFEEKDRINNAKLLFSFLWFISLIPMVLMYIINKLNKEY